MSLVIKRTDVLSYFNVGDKPAESQFAALINAMPMVYVETVALVADTDFTVTHGNAEKARIVQVVDSNGKEIGVSWRLDPTDLTNKVIINTAKAYTNAVVSILTSP